MAARITVTVTSDTACPWCWIGEMNLKEAIKDFPDTEIALQWRPFLLNPDLPDSGTDKASYYQQKFGPERYQLMMQHMQSVFAQYGVQFRTGGLVSNTFDSHRLIAFAAKSGKETALIEELFRRYFTQEQCLAHPNTLLQAAETVGLEGAKDVVENKELYADVVQQHLDKNTSITNVPHFDFNGVIQVEGAQPPEAFQEIIEKLLC